VVQQQPSFGSGDGQDGTPDLWDPDANANGSRAAAQGAASGKQWNLLVVDDLKVVNAMAAPGAQAQ
jgi:hypothetical protein